MSAEARFLKPVFRAKQMADRVADATEFETRADILLNYPTPEEDRLAARETIRPTNLTLAGGSTSAVLYSFSRVECEQLRDLFRMMMAVRRANAMADLRAAVADADEALQTE